MYTKSLAVYSHMINPHHNTCSADADPNTEEYVDVSNSDHDPVQYECIPGPLKVGEPMAVSHKVAADLVHTVDDCTLVENEGCSMAKDKNDDTGEYMIENIYETISIFLVSIDSDNYC